MDGTAPPIPICFYLQQRFDVFSLGLVQVLDDELPFSLSPLFLIV
jgi:hypothetical protein